MQLIRRKRDFGIIAAIVAAIAIAATAAVTAAVALQQNVVAATTINNITAQTAATFLDLKEADSRLATGLLVLNQRVDQLEFQTESLVELIHAGCVASTPSVCITPLKFERAKNISANLSRYLTGEWSREFENLQQKILHQIITLNGTRVQPFEGLAEAIFTAMSHIKEWAGMGSLGLIMLLSLGGFILILL